MSVLSVLNIQQEFIPGIPQIPFAGNGGKFSFVIAHSTANQQDTVQGEVNFEDSTWQNAFVHFFVGANKIIQTAPTGYIAWGAGHTANEYALHVEATEGEDFHSVYGNYVALIAGLLYDAEMPVVDQQTLYSHAETSAKWKETDHTDPLAWLCRGFGYADTPENELKAWQRFVIDVQAKWNEYHLKFGVTNLNKDVVVISESGLNVRSTPNAGSPVRYTLPKGQVIHVVSSQQSGGITWYGTTYGPLGGYVSAQFCQDYKKPEVAKTPENVSPSQIASSTMTVTVNKADVQEVLADAEQAMSFWGKVVALLKKMFHIS